MAASSDGEAAAAAAATPDLAGLLGLLDGLDDPQKADSYSISMDLERAAQLVSDRGIIYKAAKSDAEEMGTKLNVYLKDVRGEV